MDSSVVTVGRILSEVHEAAPRFKAACDGQLCHVLSAVSTAWLFVRSAPLDDGIVMAAKRLLLAVVAQRSLAGTFNLSFSTWGESTSPGDTYHRVHEMKTGLGRWVLYGCAIISGTEDSV